MFPGPLPEERGQHPRGLMQSRETSAGKEVGGVLVLKAQGSSEHHVPAFPCEWPADCPWFAFTYEYPGRCGVGQTEDGWSARSRRRYGHACYSCKCVLSSCMAEPVLDSGAPQGPQHGPSTVCIVTS